MPRPEVTGVRLQPSHFTAPAGARPYDPELCRGVMEYSAVRGGKLKLKKGTASVQRKKKKGGKGKRRRSEVEGDANAGTVKHG